MLGDKILDFKHNDLIINEKCYTGTEGLYNLIFMSDRNPFVSYLAQETVTIE